MAIERVAPSLATALSVALLASAPAGTVLSAQATQPGIGALEAAADYFGGLDGFCMAFRQTLEVPLLDETNVSEGRLCQQSPDRLRMDFHDPEGDVVVGDGEHLWVYTPSIVTGQVLRYSLSPSEGAFDIRREFLDSPLEKYDVTDLGRDAVDGIPAYRLELRPHDRTRYQKATVWVAPESRLLLQAEIVEIGGSIRTLTFSEFEAEPAFETGKFTFLVPEGVRVVVR